MPKLATSSLLYTSRIHALETYTYTLLHSSDIHSHIHSSNIHSHIHTSDIYSHIHTSDILSHIHMYTRLHTHTYTRALVYTLTYTCFRHTHTLFRHTSSHKYTLQTHALSQIHSSDTRPLINTLYKHALS
jgi:hypothetical protein